MPLALDTSVLLASLRADEPAHAACSTLIEAGEHSVYLHALAETFASLTGGQHGRRVDADTALRLLNESILPFVKTVALTERDMLKVFGDARARGIRGGAVYDALHLAAARKAGARAIVTLDTRDFTAIASGGDPAIESP